MPSFLDLVFTFKYRERPLTHALFRHENYLDEGAPSLRLPHLGRSGIQVQHAFNILTVEKSDLPGEKIQWPLRNATLYHSLDLETGRAVYMLLKSNEEVAKRIKDATEKNRYLRADTPRTPAQSFVASLQVHLILLDWGVESWSEYIDKMEDDIRSSGVEAKVAPVASVTSPVELAKSFHRRGSSFSRQGVSRTIPGRQGTMRATPSQPGAVGRQSQLERLPEESPNAPSTSETPVPPVRSGSRTLSGFLRRGARGPDNWFTTAQIEDGVAEEPNDMMERLQNAEDRFSFSTLQRLSLVEDDINRSISALEQSKGVVVQIEEQYQSVISSHGFKTMVDQESCKTSIAVFFRRISSVLRDLETHRRRLLDLSRTVANDKLMVTSWLVVLLICVANVTVSVQFEFLNQHTRSKAFQLLAQNSSNEMMMWTQKMHEIAVTGQQETLSIHVIAVLALVFLPGIFVAVSQSFCSQRYRDADYQPLDIF